VTGDELVEVAIARTLAGVPCAVVAFTGASDAHVVDFDDNAEVVGAWRVPIGHPSPGVAEREIPPE
jgi:hypothetical protein